MKKVLLVSLMMFVYFNSFAQDDSIKIVYCEIVGTQAFGKVKVVIDMGEDKGFLGLNSSSIMDEKTGKPKNFNSMIDALNYMGYIGWEFEQAYAVTSGNTNVYHFLLKQYVEKGDDGNYYPVTKKTFKSQLE